MPAIGGLKIPIPKEQLDSAKELYLSGKQWSEVAELTGIKQSSLTRIASVKGWTQIKAESKAKENIQGDNVKGAFANSLDHLAGKLKESKPKTLKQACQIQSMLVPAVQNAKTVFGWGEQQQSSALSVLAISSAEVVSSPGPVLTDPDPVQDAEIIPPADSYEI